MVPLVPAGQQDALDYDLVDDARIGAADFDEVSYAESVPVITIKGNVPVTISVRVRALAVSVQETSTIIGFGRRTTTLGGFESYTGKCWAARTPVRSSASTPVKRTAPRLASLGPGGLRLTGASGFALGATT